MRIAIVHSRYSSANPSGENVAVDEQCRALRAAGHEVSLIEQRTDDLERDPLYPVRSALRVATGMGRSPLSQIEELQPDIVHVHNLFPNWGTTWVQKTRVPVVTTVLYLRPVCAAGTLFRDGQHCRACLDSGSYNAVRFKCYRGSAVASVPLALQTRRGVKGNDLLKGSRRLVTLSDRARNFYIEQGLPAEKTALIPNFTNDRDAAGVTRSASVGPGEWVFLGRLEEGKGIQHLMDHWPPSEVLVIYGDGPLRESVVSASGGAIRYGGILPREQIAFTLRSARALIFPSLWWESAPALTYLEALAVGLPVVAKSGNAVADDVATCGSGIVFDHWSELPSALASLADREPYSQRARARFDEHYTERVWVERIEALYRDVLKHG